MPQTMLAKLLYNIADVPSTMDVAVSSVTQDSREVSSGCLFVALKGAQQHGMTYAERAEFLGAVAIIFEADESLQSIEANIPQFEITDLRESLGLIADRFYSSPSQSLQMVGITGTDGKTSVSHFMAQAINNCAVIGTIGLGLLNDLKTATHTTPDVINVHKNLFEMKQQGVATVAMEVSSHALDQGRVAGVAFDVVVLTNLSRDHLDYHKTVEAYADAKENLFHWSNLKAAVINLDDKFGRKVAEKVSQTQTIVGYGIGKAGDYPAGTLVAVDTKFTVSGICAVVQYGSQKGQLAVSVLGRFNLSNLLAALGAMLGLGVAFNDAISQLNKVQTVAGRMEKVGGVLSQSILTVVDFAHTPNALMSVLKALREHLGNESSNLICVFGCGGDRDAGKRPLMAAVAEKYADVVIATDDNPRTESPELIMRDIVAGFENKEAVTIEHDRSAAIYKALKQAKSGDAVLIAGKGHETGQILATGTIPFNDREQVELALQELAA
ncbi:MAG: UDP-N-acetylmuramoyl-L-alanyl-D-glutamate--2,6-diaminopimelate ligase [Cocleimonas sp.]|nr:UDP-N-acetylmuramoyl-L-alanyl-D-glutamate--2,6-diaminopimelate ligase [Cocleimonas sp.]